jgi:signal transduction histidine kinase
MRDSNGIALLFSGTSTDISQLKETERALREISRKLAQSNQDLEHFATVASHDLKAPLRKISIFTTQVALEKDKLSQENQDALHRIQNSIETMQTLIDDLLSWSKASWTPATMAPVALAPVLERVLATLKPLITEKDADIQIGQLDTVTGDEAQLEQLLQNLIENALKYQPPGQKPQVQICAFSSDQGVCEISVQDNGIGIKPEHTERIFQPFERLHGKASPYPGTGVGLALCKRIAEQHNGQIMVESKVGEGSRFTVRLPKPANHIQAIPSETPNAVSLIPQVDAPFQESGY